MISKLLLSLLLTCASRKKTAAAAAAARRATCAARRRRTRRRSTRPAAAQHGGRSSRAAARTTTASAPEKASACAAPKASRVPDTEATEQDKTLAIPASPVLISGSGTVDKTCTLGAIAISLNGVSIYGGAVDSACTQLDVTTTQSEWTSFDYCGGHSQNSGDYHYRFPPSCLLAQIGDLSDGHSPQVGWANDGFPIYGPLGPGARRSRTPPRAAPAPTASTRARASRWSCRASTHSSTGTT